MLAARRKHDNRSFAVHPHRSELERCGRTRDAASLCEVEIGRELRDCEGSA
jgi:hypothetical protein